jgi:2'-hydroxyisoflavone reductase
VQFIDGRDLAEWTIRMVEARQTGTYHATGPDYRLEMGPFLEACREVTANDAHFTWVSEEFLLEHEVAPFTELPLWLPQEVANLSAVNLSKAISAGLTFRPLEVTIRETLEWNATRPPYEPRSGLRPEREHDLLDAWKGRQSA